jgi:hypothetical protein
MMATLSRKLGVTITCRTCGAPLPVSMTARTIDRVTVRITTEPADIAWCELFTASHRGPFRPRSRKEAS